MSLCIRSAARPLTHCLKYSYATASTTTSNASPLLLKLRSDLKFAMKAKDSARLAVLRSILAETTNAAKTSKPISTDQQLVALLLKNRKSGRNAASEFEDAKRDDLKEKELSQISILDEYITAGGALTGHDLTAIVRDAVMKLKAQEANVQMPNVMKALKGPGGHLQGKAVDSDELISIAKEVLEAQ